MQRFIAFVLNAIFLGRDHAHSVQLGTPAALGNDQFKEFKREAMRLLKTGDRPAAVIARELGITRNRLYKPASDLRPPPPV